MLSWHSEGFPLKKAQAYVELRRPFLINDVHMQDVLLDRRRVYKTLAVRRCTTQAQSVQDTRSEAARCDSSGATVATRAAVCSLYAYIAQCIQQAQVVSHMLPCQQAGLHMQDLLPDRRRVYQILSVRRCA